MHTTSHHPKAPSHGLLARLRAVLTLLLAWLPAAMLSQPAAPLPPDSVTVSLVTFYPGQESFSIYGHTELRVVQQGRDWYYNYGVFDFETPGFVWRFVTGDAEYLCVPVPSQYAMLGMEGRRMVEQRLNLTPDEARRVADMLLLNALPDNRSYHYRYLTDNCSTRPRDILEAALQADSLDYGPAPRSSLTYRQMMGIYGRNYAWQQFGIDLVLGSMLDRPLTYREQMFIPMVLMQAVGQATVQRQGRTVPLVAQSRVVVDTSEQGLVLPPTPWWCSPLAATLLMLALAVVLTMRDMRRRRTTRWFDCLLYTVLAAIGSVITFLVLCSQHEALWPNWNLLWANPLAWLPAVGVWWLPRSRRILVRYHWFNAALVLLTLLLWPLVPQSANPAFFPLMAASLLRSLAAPFARA